DLAKSAKGIDAAEHRRQDGDEQIALSIRRVGRIEPGQHDDRRDTGEQARENIELENDRTGINAGVAGRLLVRPDHIDLGAEGRGVEHDRDRHGTERKDDQREGYAENRPVADEYDGIGKSGDDVATG